MLLVWLLLNIAGLRRVPLWHAWLVACCRSHAALCTTFMCGSLHHLCTAAVGTINHTNTTKTLRHKTQQTPQHPRDKHTSISYHNQTIHMHSNKPRAEAKQRAGPKKLSEVKVNPAIAAAFGVAASSSGMTPVSSTGSLRESHYHTHFVRFPFLSHITVRMSVCQLSECQLNDCVFQDLLRLVVCRAVDATAIV